MFLLLVTHLLPYSSPANLVLAPYVPSSYSSLQTCFTQTPHASNSHLLAICQAAFLPSFIWKIILNSTPSGSLPQFVGRTIRASLRSINKNKNILSFILSVLIFNSLNLYNNILRYYCTHFTKEGIKKFRNVTWFIHISFDSKGQSWN